MKITTKLFVPIIITCIVVVVVAGIFLHRLQVNKMEEELKAQAESVAELFVDIRHVMAVNQDRINMDSMGNFEFKALNPARVGNMVAKLVNKRASVKVKQTSLKVRNKEMDTPDPFEAKVLAEFEKTKAATPVSSRSDINGQPYYRYMKPLKIKKACLKCHGDPKGEIDISGYPKEGYKLGDIRGAISVAIPMQDQLARIRTSNYLLAGAGGLAGLLIIGCIVFFGGKYVVKPIGKLMESADRISKGDFTDPIELKSDDEIGKLAKSFERMRLSLKKSIEMLDDED